MTILPKISPRSEEDRQARLQRSLLRREAEIGGKLFGPIPKGRKRQFFCLDEHTWIWHEEWQDSKGKRQAVTTRYNVRPNGILKIQSGGGYQPLSREETRNLYRTTQLYRDRVDTYYQNLLQTA